MDYRSDINIRINEVLDRIRHHLLKDNGDIEFVSYEEENGVANVRFLGNCRTCPLSIMTLRAGIERYILKYVPEVKRIELAN
jgi:Fe-S cluster biogenesis protein NfuA